MHNRIILLFAGLLLVLGTGTAHSTLIGNDFHGIFDSDRQIPDFDQIITHLKSAHDTIETKWHEIAGDVENRIHDSLSRPFPWKDWEFPADRPFSNTRPDWEEISSRFPDGLFSHLPELRNKVWPYIPDSIKCPLNGTPIIKNTVVPEPSSVILLASGLAGLVTYHRKRRTSRS